MTSDHILSPEDNCTAAPPRTPPSLPATACSPLQRPHCSHLIQGPGASWRPSSGDHWGDVIRSIHRVNPPVLITAFVICPLPGHWLLPNCARPGLTFNTATLAHSATRARPLRRHCGSRLLSSAVDTSPQSGARTAVIVIVIVIVIVTTTLPWLPPPPAAAGGCPPPRAQGSV